ncbi:MAG TPA: hypothetical protein VK154_15760 [Chitinophagales bacterium]|nr:hypothetical protein [Chitinophagales bacterium]
MKTKLATSVFTAIGFSLLLYSCQKEESVTPVAPNKPTAHTTTVILDNPDPSKPIDNPSNPTPAGPSPTNPNHPPIDPSVTVGNSATCVNCHTRILEGTSGNWNERYQLKAISSVSHGGLSDKVYSGSGR